MRIALVVLAILGAVGCRTPPRLARTQPAPPTVEANGLVRWIDRDNGVVELRFECRETTIEVWCRGDRNTTCESKRVLSEATACPGDVVTITTAWGTTAQATVTPDGRATFTVDVMTAPWKHVAAPGPSDGWRVERSGLALGWRDQGELMIEAEKPPSRTRRPQRRYTLPLVAADLLIIGLAIPTSGLSLVAYLLSGPIVHSANGNHPAARRSIAKRLVYPLAFGGVGFVVGHGLHADREWEPFRVEAVVFAAIGGAVGVLAGMLHDWSDAHVDVSPGKVTPTVSADGDRVMFGAAGRF